MFSGVFFDSLHAQTSYPEQAIARDLKNHKFRKVHKRFNHQLGKEVSAAKLRTIWAMLEKNAGAYKSCGVPRSMGSGGQTKTVTTLYFEKMSLELETTFDNKNKLAGLFIRPIAYTLPEYGSGMVYGRIPDTVRTGNFKLPGELLLPPKAQHPYKVVILVHGSGANNRYEDMGNVMVFKDIALGLLSQGIACFVYDKRNLIYKSYFDTAQFTLRDETVDDAVQAYRLMRSRPEIDSNNIFILGHSLGGYALPLILRDCQGIKGGISMAGPSRPLDVLIEYQTKYLTGLDGKRTLGERIYLYKTKRSLKEVRSPKLSSASKKVKLLAYWPTRFWLDLRTYDPLAELRKLDTPVLFLQGDRDYQVTNDDLKGWKTLYLEKKEISFISYPKLNHLFIEGEGKPGPAEYWNGGNIPFYVVRDIVDWINR